MASSAKGDPSGSAQGISLRDFGRRVGVSGEYIRRAVELGKIPADCVGQRVVGKGKVWPVITDPAKAEKHWRASRDPDKVRDPELLAEGAKRGWSQRRGELEDPKPKPAREQRPPSTGGDDDDDGEDGVAPDGLPTIASSKRKQEVLKTRKLTMEVDQLEGRLVDAEEIRIRLTGMITAARNGLMGVPTKAKARIPTLTVRDIEVLEDLIAEALREVAAYAG